MQLTIETYRNTLEEYSPPREDRMRVIKGSYVLEACDVYADSGWTRKAWKKSMKRRQDFLGWVGGKAKIQIGTHYGIHSYQLVFLKDPDEELAALKEEPKPKRKSKLKADKLARAKKRLAALEAKYENQAKDQER